MPKNSLIDWHGLGRILVVIDAASGHLRKANFDVEIAVDTTASFYHISKELIESSNRYIDLKKLRAEIERKK